MAWWWVVLLPLPFTKIKATPYSFSIYKKMKKLLKFRKKGVEYITNVYDYPILAKVPNLMDSGSKKYDYYYKRSDYNYKVRYDDGNSYKVSYADTNEKED